MEQVRTRVRGADGRERCVHACAERSYARDKISTLPKRCVQQAAVRALMLNTVARANNARNVAANSRYNVDVRLDQSNEWRYAATEMMRGVSSRTGPRGESRYGRGARSNANGTQKKQTQRPREEV